MERLELLKQLSFGAQIAEDEVQELANYFFQTHQWDQIASGRIDIVRGEKGAGKSAIYSLLNTKYDEFFDKGVLLVAAENPRGATVFKDLVTDPPSDENEFITLWKLYIVTIVAQKMREFHISDHNANKLYGALEAEKLLEAGNDLSGILRRSQRFVRSILRIRPQIEAEFDPETYVPSYVGKLSIEEPTSELRDRGYNSIDNLFGLANSSLNSHHFNVWVLLDRLDVAFAENHTLEANALRALFRVYGDMRAYERIELKVFLREDIWNRIFSSGFREASHLNRYAVLDWSPEALRNLVIRRILSNKSLVDEYKLDTREILASAASQAGLIERLFPKDVELGKSATFTWMVNRCADGTKKTAPREIIHLLKTLLDKEIQRLERGGTRAPGEQLFDRSVFKDALAPVSHARLNQYIYAEYADYKPYILALERAKTEQSVETLAQIWEIDVDKASQVAERLVEIGFFEKRGNRLKPTFWIPFLYRDALGLIQGRAET